MPTLPGVFNAATYFVDRHLTEGRADAIAIECGERYISYATLHENVNRMGSAFRHELGVRPEERVVLLMLDSPEMVYSFFGAIKIGAVPIPTNTLWTAADYEYVLNDSRARVIVLSASLHSRVADALRRCPWVQHVVVADADQDDETIAFDDLIEAAAPDLIAASTSADAPAFWLYSSGSTGQPKACVHLQHDMVVCADNYARGVLGIRSADRCFSVARLFFAYGLGNAMYFPFSVGATSILSPGPTSPQAVYKVIEQYRPTLFFSVPTHYAMMLAHHGPNREFDLSSIRFAVSAGEALPAAVFKRFKERFDLEILDGIGSTEVLHIFISNTANQIRPGSSGVLVPGYEARLVDDNEMPVAIGEIGNLLIRGDSTCAYYWNRHEQTKDTIAGHWIRTGDHYARDEDGFFWFAGRSDDMLKVGGIWVSPIELEHTLLEHSSVQACGVTGRADRDGLIKPVAFVVAKVPDPGIELAAELQQFAKERLAAYKRPRWIEFVDSLPTTATGKLQRYKLRELVQSAT
jgi:benzoate-CoA ligase family protein